MLSKTVETLEKGVKYFQSQQKKPHQNDVNASCR